MYEHRIEGQDTHEDGRESSREGRQKDDLAGEGLRADRKRKARRRVRQALGILNRFRLIRYQLGCANTAAIASSAIWPSFS
jgi:hypothetical protein